METEEFIIVALLLSLMPGPDILLVASTAALKGIKEGIRLALGFATGLIVHTLVVWAGIATIIAQNETAFNIIKYAGITYLLYIGISGVIKTNKKSQQKDKACPIPPKESDKLYRKGIVLNILNPKVSLFFLSLFPQFITESSNKSTDTLLLGGIMIAITAIIFSCTAIVFGYIGNTSKITTKNPRIIAIAQLMLYIILAAMIIFQ